MNAVAVALTVVLTGTACTQASTGVEPADTELRLLFIGNSLTRTHDVPGLVEALAQAAGRSLSQTAIVAPNSSLEDHWNAGVADDIRRLRADVVIMQQGPSSLPESREHLALWSERLAEVIREAGGEPALYTVWPPADRRFAFADVVTSYATAAAAVDGLLLPAGATWLEAWKLDPSLPLYGPDGFHPSYLGAFAAALTIYAVLFDVEPSAAPSLDDAVTAAQRDILNRAVSASLPRREASGR